MSGVIGTASLKYANAVDFDGTNDSLARGADYTGSADSRTGIFSGWARLDGGDGASKCILATQENTVEINRNSGNKFSITVQDSGGSAILSFETSNSYVAGATWRHILASWDTNFSAGNKISHLYINDVSDKATPTDASAAFDIDYTTANHFVGKSSGGALFNGCLAEVYFAPGQFLDFSVAANRRKFISATGKPVSLGSNGSKPTGVAPILYLANPLAIWPTNRGTGGGLTLTGSLDAASTSPSD